MISRISSRGKYSRFALFSILALAFAARLWKAHGTFLNPDEALHALTAYQSSLAAAYKASLGLAHPPLFIIFLYYWHQLGSSELWLRLPSVIAGTVFCLFLFYWIKTVLGNTAAWLGFLFVCFLPPMIDLSAEVRQYAFLLCFIAIAAYLFELALNKNCAGRLALSFFFLYLAMLTHYSALFFVAALGIYSLLRLLTGKFPTSLITTWIIGQLGAFGLFAFLYKTHISVQRSSDQAHRAFTESLPNSFFHRGHDHLLSFAFARTFGTFQFLCSQLAIGDLAGLIFLIGIVLLFRKTPTQASVISSSNNSVISSEAKRPEGSFGEVEKPALVINQNSTNAASPQNRSSLRLFAIFLLLPYILNCAVAYADLYPYGGTRHSSFISLFAIAGISYALTIIFRAHAPRAIAVIIIAIILCQLLGSPHRPYMTRRDQSKANMTTAITTIKNQAAPGSLLFIDLQTNFLLQNYLCPTAVPDTTSLPGFWTYSCSGYTVVSTTPDQSIFTSDLLFKKWIAFTHTSAFHPGQPVWIFQSGWNIHLAEDVPPAARDKAPIFNSSELPFPNNLHPQTFGHNITLFRWM
jgi:uncharacterized membrane protein